MDELTKYQIWALCASFVIVIMIVLITYSASIPWTEKLDKCVSACNYELKEAYLECGKDYNSTRFQRVLEYESMWNPNAGKNYSTFINKTTMQPTIIKTAEKQEDVKDFYKVRFEGLEWKVK